MAHKILPKCDNCKYGHSNFAADHCALPNNLPDRRTLRYTTNSQNTTHCDQHQFDSKTKKQLQ